MKGNTISLRHIVYAFYKPDTPSNMQEAVVVTAGAAAEVAVAAAMVAAAMVVAKTAVDPPAVVRAHTPVIMHVLYFA